MSEIHLNGFVSEQVYHEIQAFHDQVFQYEKFGILCDKYLSEPGDRTCEEWNILHLTVSLYNNPSRINNHRCPMDEYIDPTQTRYEKDRTIVVMEYDFSRVNA